MASREIHSELDDLLGIFCAGLECMFLVSIFTFVMRKGVEYKKITILNLLSGTELHTSISVSSGSDFKDILFWIHVLIVKAITCSLLS